MLANGTRLYYSTAETRPAAGADTGWTEIPGIKEIPELGTDAELVDNTTLTDSVKHNEMGIGDPGNMEYQVKWDNVTTANKAAYQAMRTAQGSKTNVHFKEVMFDQTTTLFDGQVSVKRSSGGVNGVIDWTLGIALTSDFEITDPA